MKSVFHTFLIICLLFSTFGVTVSSHFCGEMLVKSGLGNKVQQCCDGMEMPEGCCHDESARMSVDDDFQFSASSFDFSLGQQVHFLLPDLALFFKLGPALSTAFVFTDTYGETPPRSGPSLFLRVGALLL